MATSPKHEIVTTIAELLYQCQVPRSIGMLDRSAGIRDAHDRLRDQLGIFGWPDRNEIEQAIEEAMR